MGVDHSQEGAFRVGVGEHEASGYFGAVFQGDARSAAVADIDTSNWGAGADLDIVGTRGSRESLSDCAHTAHHVAVKALQMVVAAAE